MIRTLTTATVNGKSKASKPRALRVGSVLGAFAILALAACATSSKIQAVQSGDDKLSCQAIDGELRKLDASLADIDNKKGVTGTNVASALFWLPGLAYTYYDAGEASRLIYERRSHLSALRNDKDC
jgi:hypothetical protein